jgi:hypothetical protein
LSLAQKAKPRCTITYFFFPDFSLQQQHVPQAGNSSVFSPFMAVGSGLAANQVSASQPPSATKVDTSLALCTSRTKVEQNG